MVGKKSQKYSLTAEQDIWIYYRDIGLMDTPVEPEKAQEDELDEQEAIRTISLPPAQPRKHRKGRTAEAARPITGIYTLFTFCPYDPRLSPVGLLPSLAVLFPLLLFIRPSTVR